MSRRFDDLLNDCLERMNRGEDVRQCIDRYPEHRHELLPLLNAAAATMQVATSSSYRPEARARGLKRLTQALSERGASSSRRFPLLWRPVARPLVIGLAAVVLMVVAAGGTSLAASDSVPGDSLYWVKTTKENISLRLPRSNANKAKIHARLAKVRGREMSRLIASGRFQRAEKLARRISRHLNRSAQYAGILVPPHPIEMPVRHPQRRISPTDAELIAMLERDGTALKAGLSELWSHTSPLNRQKVRQLMRQSDLGYRIIIGALHDDTLRVRPFWRIEPTGSRSR